MDMDMDMGMDMDMDMEMEMDMNDDNRGHIFMEELNGCLGAFNANYGINSKVNELMQHGAVSKKHAIKQLLASHILNITNPIEEEDMLQILIPHPTQSSALQSSGMWASEEGKCVFTNAFFDNHRTIIIAATEETQQMLRILLAHCFSIKSAKVRTPFTNEYFSQSMSGISQKDARMFLFQGTNDLHREKLFCDCFHTRRVPVIITPEQAFTFIFPKKPTPSSQTQTLTITIPYVVTPTLGIERWAYLSHIYHESTQVSVLSSFLHTKNKGLPMFGRMNLFKTGTIFPWQLSLYNSVLKTTQASSTTPKNDFMQSAILSGNDAAPTMLIRNIVRSIADMISVSGDTKMHFHTLLAFHTNYEIVGKNEKLAFLYKNRINHHYFKGSKFSKTCARSIDEETNWVEKLKPGMKENEDEDDVDNDNEDDNTDNGNDDDNDGDKSGICPPRSVRILVRTTGHKMRKFSNMEDIVKILEHESGYAISFATTNETMSVYDQASVFHATGLLISTHSSQLVNVVYMKQNSGVVEVAPILYSMALGAAGHLSHLTYRYTFGFKSILNPIGQVSRHLLDKCHLESPFEHMKTNLSAASLEAMECGATVKCAFDARNSLRDKVRNDGCLPLVKEVGRTFIVCDAFEVDTVHFQSILRNVIGRLDKACLLAEGKPWRGRGLARNTGDGGK
eukprot:m.7930 g.7930  ORF g.7930 m.7930 type:complete len:678 (+) comp2966_c0_seq1:3-2036(+)